MTIDLSRALPIVAVMVNHRLQKGYKTWGHLH